MRYKNLLMVLITMVLTKYAVVNIDAKNTNINNVEFILLCTSVLFLTAGGYIINDIFDIKTDAINKPHKMFIETFIPIKKAKIYYFLCTLIGFITGTYISILKSSYANGFIFFTTPILLYFYSKSFKKNTLIGNLTVAFLTALPIYLVYSFSTDYNEVVSTNNFLMIFKIATPQIFLYLFFAFTTTLIREIIKDIEDVNGDLAIKAKTIPIVVGRKRAANIALFCSGFLVFMLMIVLLRVRNQPFFLLYGIAFILAPLLYFTYHLWIATNKSDYSRLSKILKIIMLFGILSMLLFLIK
ncbi:geranylgeranylglycerol-phosphate geranylgeranyltransferase [Polaribacter tangerinus]|uniref:geranylgeranylglycerol-phosphate geranylgeranyltransferase n=1 Tax=Polaribacter tangerinus TaxID=1920034 RepID=UPI001302ECB1|nr:geranylgeranylglycerol-phosphate geranylgeranyltransferase [Polaribacter tangerinus]